MKDFFPHRCGVFFLTLCLISSSFSASCATSIPSSSLLVKSKNNGQIQEQRLPSLALTKKRRQSSILKNSRGGAGGLGSDSSNKKKTLAYPILCAYLYNLSIGFTIPVLPKIINLLINGDPKVSPKSASFYGVVSAVDQTMTFLLVNGACHLSDRYGRKPFLALANLGLGTGQVIASFAKDPRLLLIGSFIDGCTSYSYPLCQSYIADITDPSKLPQAYGLFQGVATGAAFLLGIPLSGILAAKFGLKLPLYIAASICVLNILYISTVLPESLPPSRRNYQAKIEDAHAIGAFKTVCRNPFIALCSLTYFFLHLALNGLQINFVNYTQYRYGWNVAQSSSSLCLIFFFTALFPRLLLPYLGTRRAIQLCSVIFALGFLLLGVVEKTWMVLGSLVVIAAGSVSLPATLAYLINQVSAQEKGLMNGAADTVRTLSTAVGFPLMTGLFAYFISDDAPVKLPGAALYLGSILSLLALLSLQIALKFFDHHDESVSI